MQKVQSQVLMNVTFSHTIFHFQGVHQASSIVPLHLEEDVIVSAIEEGFNTFYIQRKVDEKEIKSLNAKIAQTTFKLYSSPIISQDITCIAPFSEDGVWYRAIPVLQEKDECRVLFVDYGNSDRLSVSRVKSCPPNLDTKRIPPFAIPCFLWNFEPAKPEEWCEKAIPLFLDLVQNADQINLFVYSAERNTELPKSMRPKCLVDLRCCFNLKGVSEDFPVSIRDYFLFMELGKSLDSDKESPHPKTSIGSMPLWRRTFLKPDVQLNDTPVSVNISCITSLPNFYVQMESSCQDLSFLLSELQLHCSSQSVANKVAWKIFIPQIGIVCAAKRTSTNFWHRACIEMLKPGHNVEVFFVDTGEHEVVHFEQLRKIPDKFLELPSQAIHCQLFDISPLLENGELEENAILHYKELMKKQEAPILAVFHSCTDDTYELSLTIDCPEQEASLPVPHEEDEDITSAQTHFDCNFGSSMSSDISSWVQNIPNDHFQLNNPKTLKRINTRKKSSQILYSFPDQDVTMQKELSAPTSVFHRVDFLAVTSPTLIHLRLLSIQPKFEIFQDRLQQKMKSTQNDKANFAPTLGEVCVVKLIDRSPPFARAKLLHHSNSSWKVHLIDCGGILDVLEDSLTSLPQDLNEPQSYALIASITEIIAPCGQKKWPTSTLDSLKFVLDSKVDIYMVKKGKAYKDGDAWNLKVLPIDLGWIEEVEGGPFEANQDLYFSIRDHLLDNGLALPQRNNSVKRLSSTSTNSASEIVLENTSFDSSITIDHSIEDCITKLTETNENPPFASPKNESHRMDSLPPQNPLPKHFEATITNVDMEGLICLHTSQSRETLACMSQAHNEKFRDSRISNSDLTWHVGDYVVAKYHLDGCWYRAQILNLKEDGEVKAEFIDYGNEEILSLTDIRTCAMFTDIPVQCYKCSLGILPVSRANWSEKILDCIHLLLVTKEVSVTVLEHREGHQPLVTLKEIGKDERELTDILVNTLKICRYASSLIEESDVEDDFATTSTSEGNSVRSDGKISTLPLPSSPVELIVVKVVSIIDPSTCYVRPEKELVDPLEVSEFFKQIQRAIDRLQELVSFVSSNNERLKHNEFPEIGGLYMTPLRDDGSLYLRVRILSFEEDQAEVIYIDYGNIDSITLNRLYNIPQQYLDIPALAIKVQLDGVRSTDGKWSEEAMREMNNCLLNTDDKIYASFLESGGIIPRVNLFFKDRNGLSRLCYKKLFEDKIISA